MLVAALSSIRLNDKLSCCKVLLFFKRLQIATIPLLGILHLEISSVCSAELERKSLPIILAPLAVIAFPDKLISCKVAFFIRQLTIAKTPRSPMLLKERSKVCIVS